MVHRMKKVKIVLGLVLVLLVAAVSGFGSEMWIVPTEPVQLVADLESRNSTDPAVTIAMLPVGERVRVTACRNFVDDQLYRVVTDTGQEGWVARGRFELEQTPHWGLDSVVCW